MGRRRISSDERAAREALGHRLAEAIALRGKSARGFWLELQAAGVPGVRDRSTVVKVLAGQTRVSAEMIGASATILGVSVEWLLGAVALTGAPILPPGAGDLPRWYGAAAEARYSARDRRRVTKLLGPTIADAVLAAVPWRAQPYERSHRGYERLDALVRFDRFLQDSATVRDPFRTVEGRAPLVVAAGRFLLACEEAMAGAVAMLAALESPERSRLQYSRFADAVLAIFASQVNEAPRTGRV